MSFWSRRNGNARDEASLELERLAAPLRLKDILYGINLSLRYRYLYCETPKVASSTIKSVLQNLELGEFGADDRDIRRLWDRQRAPLLNPLQVPRFGELLADGRLFKFCFVRNPYSRVVSAYLDKVQIDPDSRRRFMSRQRMRGRFWFRDCSFKDFVNLALRKRPEQLNLHWRPQVMQTFWGKIPYDFVGHLETFDRDFRVVLDRLGVPNLSTRGVAEDASGATKRMHEYYDDETEEAVYTLYRQDFETFDYARGIPNIGDRADKPLPGG